MFLIYNAVERSMTVKIGFNPLNQVYVFNLQPLSGCSTPSMMACFNPLNQVYVFNQAPRTKEATGGNSFNPLNQVYVFNKRRKLDKRYSNLQVLIP